MKTILLAVILVPLFGLGEMLRQAPAPSQMARVTVENFSIERGVDGKYRETYTIVNRGLTAALGIGSTEPQGRFDTNVTGKNVVAHKGVPPTADEVSKNMTTHNGANAAGPSLGAGARMEFSVAYHDMFEEINNAQGGVLDYQYVAFGYKDVLGNVHHTYGCISLFYTNLFIACPAGVPAND